MNAFLSVNNKFEGLIRLLIPSAILIVTISQ